MLSFTHTLMSDLTLTLAHGEEAYIQINGTLATCLLSVKIEAGASYEVESSLDSTEAFLAYTLHSEGIWEDIIVDGVTYAELTFDINSVLFRSPNILYINNTSATESIKVSLRGNR